VAGSTSSAALTWTNFLSEQGQFNFRPSGSSMLQEGLGFWLEQQCKQQMKNSSTAPHLQKLGITMFFRPKKLYKYLSAAGAQLLFSSPNPTIWFRLPNRLNDIYDIRPVGSHLDGFGTIASFCLSETPDSAPMWAHYGSNGQGIVLEFSLSSEFFEVSPPIKVRYGNRRPTVKDTRAALVTKNVEWAYEREWRCFMSLPKSSKDKNQFLSSEQAVSVPFPFDALSAVIHGHDSRVSAEEFLARPEASHVRQLVCRTKAWSYGLNICPIGDLTHILEGRAAVLWGRQQRRK
jgi:hypothetical protein